MFLRSWRSLRLRIGRTACARRNSISLFRDRRSRAASLAKRALRFAGIRINSRSWRLVICLDIMFPFAIDGQRGRSHSDNIVISPSGAKVIGRPECRLCATSNFRASVSCELRKDNVPVWIVAILRLFTGGNPIQGFIMFAACIDRIHSSELRLKGSTSVA